MKLFGAHVSTEGGVQNAPANALAIGAGAFALFTKNQRRWDAPPLSSENIDGYRRSMEECGFDARVAVAHISYLVNLGSPDKAMLERSMAALIDELQRCQALGVPYLNIHPGSHLGKATDDECIRQICDCVNRALEKTSGVAVLFESTAGQGAHVGHRFEHLALLIDGVEDKARTGFCLDTCHAFAAGYDLRTKASYAATMKALDDIVGLDQLKSIHLNDSLSALGSRKDRHASIGKGEIGKTAFQLLAADPRLDGIPIVLETPNEDQWAAEIKMLSRWAKKT
jgi:deoxyribonuclease-4